MNLNEFIKHQRVWSEVTFGPGERNAGHIDHIRKEIEEIEAEPADLEEWCDVIILALDAAWRNGFEPEQISDMLEAKQRKNMRRTWPDWTTADPGKAIEHVEVVI